MAPDVTPSTAAGRTALCPGTYDPVTYGHLDIIERAAGMFDRIVVGVVRHPQHKQPFFPIEQRLELLARGALADLERRRCRVLDPGRRIRAGVGGQCARQGPARRLGLRMGIADGPPQ